MIDAIRSRKLSSVQAEQLRLVGDRVAHVYGLKIDALGRLGEREQVRLLDLAKGATPEDSIGYGGINVEQLDRGERREWEKLIEKAAGVEPGALEREREEAKGRAKVAEIARRALMPAPRPCFEEEGSVRIPQVAFRHLDRKATALLIRELGLLAFLWLQLENAKSLSPEGRVERDDTDGEPVLVVNRRFGLGTKYEYDRELSGWERDLAHLNTNGWLRVERRGDEIRVKRGPRALAADRKPKAKRKETKK